MTVIGHAYAPQFVVRPLERGWEGGREREGGGEREREEREEGEGERREGREGEGGREGERGYLNFSCLFWGQVLISQSDYPNSKDTMTTSSWKIVLQLVREGGREAQEEGGRREGGYCWWREERGREKRPDVITMNHL